MAIPSTLALLFYCLLSTLPLSHSWSSVVLSMSSTQPPKTSNDNNNIHNNMPIKPRVLCLHGKFQSGAILSNKIAGARRKLARVYDLHFIDGPIVLQDKNDNGDNDTQEQQQQDDPPRAWWLRNDDNGQHVLVNEALDHILEHPTVNPSDYQGIIGFSQGGTLAAALAMTGAFDQLQAVVTAGSPLVNEALEAGTGIRQNYIVTTKSDGKAIPKLHFAGETDVMVPVDSTEALCARAGAGQVVVHDKGHLFPTKAVHVKTMMDFLATCIQPRIS